MSISILQVRDKNGKFVPIPAIKGDKGDKGKDGTMTFSDLTEEQKASLNGKDGLTPFIGANGNWWIGETDTGIKAYADIASGSYVGTDSTSLVLAFDFVPSCILIEGGTVEGKVFGMLSPLAGAGFSIDDRGDNVEVYGCYCTVEGNTVTINNPTNIGLNNLKYSGGPGLTYNYIAFA